MFERFHETKVLFFPARSPVFRAMFSNKDCVEVKNSEMTILSVEKEALQMFLKFLYTAQIPVLVLSLYMEVLELAEKYQVEDLKSLCESEIASKMTLNDPVHEIYQFAFTYNCSQQLKIKSFDLIKQ